MKRSNFSITYVGALCAILLAFAFAGCATPSANVDSQKNDTSKTDITTPKIEVPTVETPAVAALPTIRIKAGIEEPLKDSKGNTWAPDTGFDGGQSVDRPDIEITGTDRPELYHSEHYGMDSFSMKVPNGNYNVSLHFSEDYDGLTDPAMRIFTYTVKDGDPTSGKTIKEVKDFSPWKAAGAQYKAYVDTIPVTVTNGEISIAFTKQVENPQINAIEIAPR